MKVALMAEDPGVALRCWLFVAMSKMQLGELEEARDIIRQVYRRVALDDDKVVVVNMCKGIWTRLQFHWKIRSHLLKA